jgi:hypothetical protein
MGLRVAISGSRTFDDRRLVEQVVDRLIVRRAIIHVGDASRGVDRMVAEYIMSREDDVADWRVYKANWKAEGWRAGHNRNDWMISESDELIAIFAPGPFTPGTLNAVRCASRRLLPTFIYHEGAWTTTPP